MPKLQGKYLIVIAGPTASGKTELSVQIAKHFNSDIFSCDSRQFYKQLNIGVAKPNSSQLKQVKHHFISNINITDYYSISKFEKELIKKLESYFENKNIAIMTGGSGLYIDAVCKGVDEMPDIEPETRNAVIEKYNQEGLEGLRFELKRVDPAYYNQVDLKNHKRIMRALEMFYATGKPFSEFRTNKNTQRNFNIIKIGIKMDRELLYERINKRVDLMIEQGLIEETKSLYKYKNLTALKTIGYKELFEYLDGNQNIDKAIELIKRNTRHYARRQITWLKRYKDLKWFDFDDLKGITNFINNEQTKNK